MDIETDGRIFGGGEDKEGKFEISGSMKSGDACEFSIKYPKKTLVLTGKILNEKMSGEWRSDGSPPQKFELIFNDINANLKIGDSRIMSPSKIEAKDLVNPAKERPKNAQSTMEVLAAFAARKKDREVAEKIDTSEHKLEMGHSPQIDSQAEIDLQSSSNTEALKNNSEARKNIQGLINRRSSQDNILSSQSSTKKPSDPNITQSDNLDKNKNTKPIKKMETLEEDANEEAIDFNARKTKFAQALGGVKKNSLRDIPKSEKAEPKMKPNVASLSDHPLFRGNKNLKESDVIASHKPN